MEIADLQREHFEPLVGQRLTLHQPGGEPLEAELVEVRSAGAAPPPGPDGRSFREPFALVVRGPRRPALGQGVVDLEHPELGRFELFVVPVREDAAGRFYEAVFG